MDEDTSVTSLRWLSSGKQASLTSGSLKGYADYINGRGSGIVTPGETPLRGVPYYQDQLDTFAGTLTDVLNNTIPETFEQPGGPFKALVSAADGSHRITAANITLSTAWANDASFIMTKKGNLDTTHILNLKQKLGVTQMSFAHQNGSEQFNGTFLDYLKEVGTTLASDVSYHEGRLKASTSISSTLQDRRDSISGVSVDEENSQHDAVSKVAAGRFAPDDHP